MRRFLGDDAGLVLTEYLLLLALLISGVAVSVGAFGGSLAGNWTGWAAFYKVLEPAAQDAGNTSGPTEVAAIATFTAVATFTADPDPSGPAALPQRHSSWQRRSQPLRWTALSGNATRGAATRVTTP